MKPWNDFLHQQELLLGKEIVDKWLRSLKVIHFDSGNLYLEASDSFQILWFEEHIRPLASKHLVNNNFRPIKVHLTAAQELTEKKPVSKNRPGVPKLQLIPDKIDPHATLDPLSQRKQTFSSTDFAVNSLILPPTSCHL